MKRQALKQISKDDCEESETRKRNDLEGAALASEQIIKERILKRAKLGGSDQLQLQSESPVPLKLFSQGFLTGKDQTIANKDFSIKTTQKSTMEEHSQESACSQDNSAKHSAANSVCSDDVSATEYPDDAFSRNISRLNTAVSKWIAAQVVKNPICDLTPIFNDYKRYFKDFNRETLPSPSSSASPVNNNSSETPCRPPQDISTVTPLLESREKPSTTQPLGGLLFSKPSTQVHTFSAPSIPSSKITFSSTTAAESRLFRFNPLAKPSRPVASTGQVPDALKPADFPPLKSGSVLEALISSQPQTGRKDESSGQEAPTITSVANLTTSAPPHPTLSIPGIIPLSTPSSLPSFNFKTLPMPSSFPPSSSLTEITKREPQSSHSLFFPPVSLPGSIHVPTSSDGAGDGEDGEDTQDQDQPGTPPALKLDTEDTVFTCRSKIFVKRVDGFVDLGISTLRVRRKQASSKTQLLVRTNASLTKILINVIINSATPLSKPRDREVMIMCPKTPPDTGGKSEDNQAEDKDSRIEIDTFLIRVKTEDLASTLFSLLEEAKRKLQ